MGCDLSRLKRDSTSTIVQSLEIWIDFHHARSVEILEGVPGLLVSFFSFRFASEVRWAGGMWVQGTMRAQKLQQ